MPGLRLQAKAASPAVDKLARHVEVRKNLRELARYYFKGTDGKPYRLADYHVEILEAMFEGGYLIVNVPTDHMKSSLGDFLFPLFSLMDDPNETHIICGANVNDSKRRVQAIERELETNTELTKDFPWVARPRERQDRIWTATQFNVAGRTVNKPNPSVLASAIGSNDLKGRRGKLIMDDVEGEDARWSPTKREQLYSWLKFEAWRCFEDQRESERPLLCLLGTPFDIDSIYFRMEAQGWKTIRYPVYTRDEHNVKVYRKDGSYALQHQIEYLWPEKKDKVMRARASLRKLEFAVAYLMDPTGGDPSRISASEIAQRVQEAEQIEAEATGFVSLDPATGGVGRQVDYAGIAVVKIHWPQGDELPKVELQEAHAFTQGLHEQVHFCAALSRDYGYSVLYEVNAQQGGTYQNTFMHLHPEVELLRHFTSHANKFDISMGLTVVKRLAVDRKLYVAPDRLDTDGVQALVQEIRDLQPPFKLHNHISAAIWFAVRYVYERVRHYKGPAIKLTYNPLNPMHQAAQIWGYRDDPGLHPVERARQAMAYDRAARNPQSHTVVGYKAWGRRQTMPWEEEVRKEQDKLWERLTRRGVG